MGPSVAGRVKDLVGKPATLDDGRPGGFYLTRFRNLAEKHPKFIRGYGFEGGSGCSMFPSGAQVPGFGQAFKEEIRRNYGAYIGMGGFGVGKRETVVPKSGKSRKKVSSWTS